MGSGSDTLKVVLEGENRGVKAQKTLTFKRGEYHIAVDVTLHNQASQAWQGYFLNRISRNKPAEKKAGGMFMVSSFTGASYSAPGDKVYNKQTFDKIAQEPVTKTVMKGWIAMQQHYFLSAWIPQAEQNNVVTTALGNNGLYQISLRSPEFVLAPGQKTTYQTQLYVGPEDTQTLSQLAEGLDLTIDYGILWFIAAPLFWALAHIHSVVGNWGVAIILVTVLIKLLFHGLSAKSYRSMANMRKLQPKIEAIRERYADDQQKMGAATMELYQKEGINPLGGCLPMLIQIPVFISLYWVLIESVELRHAPFFGWIQDLSAADPYYILPIFMGLSMLLQQKMNPPPPDPTQAKVMLMLPVVFTVLFISFPAGLVLYWIVNNVVSVLQQWIIMRQHNAI